MKSEKRKELIIIAILIKAILLGCSGEEITPAAQHSSGPKDIIKPPPDGKDKPQDPPTEKAKVEEIARKTTVQLVGCRGQLGSGVIISSKEGKFYVLTGYHAIGGRPGKAGNCQVITYNGKTLEINARNYEHLVRIDSELDLAIIELPSQGNENYTAAKLSSYLEASQTVLISGWKNCLPEREYEFNPGNIVKILSSKSDLSKISGDEELLYNKEIDYQEGYRVNYTNPTMRGMSGGPVFDADGRVVAIHGKAGFAPGARITKDCSALNHGNGWGIPIDLFSGSSLTKEIRVEVEKEPPSHNPPVTLPIPPPNPEVPRYPSNDEDIFLCPETLRQMKICN